MGKHQKKKRVRYTVLWNEASSFASTSPIAQRPHETLQHGVHAGLIALACGFVGFKHGFFHPQRDLLRVLRLNELGVLPVKKATLPLVLLPTAPPGEHH